MQKFFRLVGIFGILILLSGCLTQTLQTKSTMAQSLFVDPVSPAKRVVFIAVRNTSGHVVNLQSKLESQLMQKGYSITQDDANTIAALKELGYFDKAGIHDSAEGMTGAVVWYGNEDMYYEYLQITKEQDNDMPETVDYSRDYADEYNKNIRFTDPEQRRRLQRRFGISHDRF